MRPPRLAHLLLALAAHGAILRAQHGDAPAGATAGALSPAALRADFEAFRTLFLARDRSYSPAARTEAEQRLARLESAADTLNPAFAELELSRIAALGDNGHTGISAAMRSTRFNRVAIRFAPFGEDFHVLLAQGAHADLLGARLIAIDQRPVAELRASARLLTGGTDGWRDRSVAFFLESPAQMHALGVIAQPDAATYHLELTDGRRVSRRITADAPDASRSRAGARRAMYPEPAPGDGTPWQPLLAVAQAPWALREPATPFRWRDAPEINGIVIEMRQNVGAPGNPIEAFLARMDSLLRDRKPQHVVLDLRMNGGGDLNKTRAFVQRLPSLASGRVFVLTSPYTFSAAISTVGYLKQAAPDRVTIVGEMVGDRLVFFAEGQPTALPGSGVMIGVATERHDYATGCRPYTDCHGPVVRNPISVPTLAPAIAAPWTIAAYRAGRDPAMEAVIAALR